MSVRRFAAVDVVLVVALAAAELLLASRLIGTDAFFDEGVYLAALDALRHGQDLGRDVFTAQPPGYYELLRGIGAVAGRSVEAVRWAHVAVVCVGVAAAYLTGLAVAGRLAAVAAAGAVVVAYPLPLFVPRVLADPPAVALATLAVALAAAAARWPRRAVALAAASGAALAAATLVKLYAPLALPAVALLARPQLARRTAASFAAGAAAVALLVLAPHADALPELWNGAVTYHREAAGLELLDNVDEVRQVLNPRMPATWLAAAAAALALVAAARRRALPGGALWTWPLLGGALVLWHDPLLEHHLVVFALPLALAAGVTLGAAVTRLEGRTRTAAAVVLLLALGTGYAQAHRRAASERRPEEPAQAWAASVLRTTAPGALVASDQPLAAFLADRRVPGELVDTALLRFRTGSLTEAGVLETLERSCVQAVVAGRVFRLLDGFDAELRARFRDSRTRYGTTVYLDPRWGDCR